MLFFILIAAASADDEDLVDISWDEAMRIDKSANTATPINLKQWLNLWGHLCHGSSGTNTLKLFVIYL